MIDLNEFESQLTEELEALNESFMNGCRSRGEPLHSEPPEVSDETLKALYARFSKGAFVEDLAYELYYST